MEVSNFPLVAPPRRGGEVEQEVQDQGNLQATCRQGQGGAARSATNVPGEMGWEQDGRPICPKFWQLVRAWRQDCLWVCARATRM